ncbi:protein of unknown function [Nonlabens sp. Hel1_33_55]|uniref:DUF4837 family protein n=1 Tax=Nonlabens sp. Hel1_33_55 TaxID=1336802 RepID=UPI000875AC7B|nr:DUF4837 family protein [Nonlabens sp. Hel1_33_55]SCY33173.1 protein of unknown function [Nonlabens sp. Hel1_33_55]
MKYYTFLLLSLIMISCNEKSVRINDSAGKLNDILVVVDSDNWDGQIGDSIRAVLARPIDGIVREEPMFTLNQVKPESFSGMLKKSRNYLFIQQSDSTGVAIRKDKYALPQLGVILRGPNTAAIAKAISDNANDIINIFNDSEIAEKQRLIGNIKLNTDGIADRFGIKINVPQAYRYAATDDPDFTWLRRDIVEGTMDIMIYEVPLEEITRDSTVVQDIVRVRDSIGSRKIPVDNGTFLTEPAFSPFVNETQIDGKFAFETKGTWYVKNKFMAGPFVNYAVYNEAKKNWLIIEGYVSAPNAEQRNYLFELEAILKSIEFVD